MSLQSTEVVVMFMRTLFVYPILQQSGCRPIYMVINTQRFWKLIYLHLPTDCFMKISLPSTGLRRLERNLHEYKFSIEHSTTCDSRTNLNYMVINITAF